MTDISPETVAKMLDGVSEAPWHVEKCSCHYARCSYHGTSNGSFMQGSGYDEADANFIAWAREAVPALAARLAVLERTIEQMHGPLSIATLEARAEAAEAKLAASEARVEKLREALTQVYTLDDNPECCGHGVSDGYSPPECCGQPEYGLDRAKKIATAALQETAQ